ncbi:MAG TPA: MBL fold metallo-hydrolase, partial [Planctomycetota bacterium]|nr:MBL fold metallo-hydrolase [Planctomycetota bacterium]
FVDDRCIDCDQCRELAPSVFGDGDGHALVARQPADGPERRRAGMAVLTCPVGAIGGAPAVDALPELIEDDVWFCGYASEKSFGASSYLIRRPSGNVLVDSPRFTAPLVQRLDALGGVSLLVLSHGDDVADHAKFRERYGCDRVMHVADADFAAERPVDGLSAVDLAPDLRVIPVPGHTAGSIALLHREKFLFTGDHLWWDPGQRSLAASRRYCWHSWEEQKRSMARLAAARFEWVLPGHGRRAKLPDGPAAVAALAARM